ncbi:MAG: sigma-70 family RNA polymerase sigma factor [Deltaproteobacteria bacterium]|nr:sigma-70 family RNA polymerase sigma factor [Deltaproteobacteria bacterium]
MHASDEELLARVRGGDRRALDALLARHEDRIYRFGMRLCGEPEDARDVLQETLLALARSSAGFEGRSTLSTWLFTVARSFCIKKRRRRKGAPARLESLDEAGVDARALVDPARRPDEAAAGRELAEALEAALAALEPAMREVVVLRDVEGLSAAETAAVLGLSVKATKSRLHRARVKLRELLAPLRDEAEPGCPEIERLWSRHQEGEISARTCARMERHIAGCARCRERCDTLGRTLALCQSAPGPALPAPVRARVRQSVRTGAARDTAP